MKHSRPNVLIVSADSEAPSTAAEPQNLARLLARDGWVYFAEVNRDGVEDSDDGVRFLRWQDTLVDHFGSLEAVVVVDDRDLAKRLSHRRDDIPVILWDRIGATVESEEGISLAHVESFNRASQILPIVESYAFSSTAAL